MVCSYPDCYQMPDAYTVAIKGRYRWAFCEEHGDMLLGGPVTELIRRLRELHHVPAEGPEDAYRPGRHEWTSRQ